jgi:glycosyltransferase involved in cell wall biosynthesis
MAAKTLYQWIKPDYFNNRYNIGYWVWETPKLPEQWQPIFNLFGEIWTPSSFSADAIAKVSLVPVIKIPHSIALPSLVIDRAALNLPKDQFIFLFIFHPESGYERKNPEAVIQAVKQAFGTNRQDILLILKTKDLPEPAIAQLQVLTENSPSIQIINEPFTRDQINGLLHSCDCYVSLHRAEGFGLTIAEAMFYGKPAIATAYSGNTEFMTSNNSFLVNYELTTLDQDFPPYQTGSQWAEPDIDQAANLMRHVFEHQEHAKQVGAKAANDMRSRFSPQAIGSLIQQRLDYLTKSDRLQSSKHRQAPSLFKPKAQPKAQPSPAGIVRERIVLDPTALPTVLILTPVKNAVEFLPKYLENVLKLSYPHNKISLGFLESDSSDGTFDWLQENLPKVSQKFRHVHLFRRDFHFNHYPLPRWEFRIQFNRRSVLAKSRNMLLHQALRDENWVLWLDVDVAEYPIDVIQQLLQTGKDIVVPNCVVEPGGKTFDLNTFKFKPGAESQDWTPHMVDGIILPPAEGMTYLQDLRDQDIVEVDGVGGTMLLIKADLHREGLIFPTFSYNLYIETNGLSRMAKDMGYTCWGLPQLEIIHR